MGTEPTRRKRGRPPHPDILTPREWQVLDLLRQGLTNEQIAHRLDISYATAKYRVAEIISKLGVTSRDEAAAWQPEPVPNVWGPIGVFLMAIMHKILRLTFPRIGIATGLAASLIGLVVLTWAAADTGKGDDAVLGDPSPSESVTLFPTAGLTPNLTATPASVPPRLTEAPDPFVYGAFPWRNALYSIDPDNGELDIFLDRPPTTYDWSPDGTRVAYVPNIYEPTVAFLTPKGEPLGAITVSPIVHIDLLSWSPSGTHIAVIGYLVDDSQPVQVTAIAFLNVESRLLTSVYKQHHEIGLEGGYGLSSTLQWSPDGRVIFESIGWGTNQGQRTTSLLDVNGTVEKVSDPSMIHAVPTHPDAILSPDGEWFAYLEYPQLSGLHGVTAPPTGR